MQQEGGSLEGESERRIYKEIGRSGVPSPSRASERMQQEVGKTEGEHFWVQAVMQPFKP
jgi:hypothetical protein